MSGYVGETVLRKSIDLKNIFYSIQILAVTAVSNNTTLFLIIFDSDSFVSFCTIIQFLSPTP